MKRFPLPNGSGGSTAWGLCCALATCILAFTTAPPATALQTKKTSAPSPPPAEVRARMAARSRSLRLLRLPTTKGAPALLMHVWVLEKPLSSTSASGESTEEKLRFHIDFFARQKGKWRLRLPTSYLASRPTIPFGYPGWGTYEAHWLNAKRKRGLVVVERVYLGAVSSVRLLTLPQGIPLGERVTAALPYQVQMFSESNFGGGTSRITFGREDSGQMRIEDEACGPGGYQKSVFVWRGGTWKEMYRLVRPLNVPTTRSRPNQPQPSATASP